MSSAKFYPKQAHFERKSQVIPNSLIFHRELSDASKVLIAALNGIYTSAPGWVPIQSDLQHRLGWGRDKMRNVIKECQKYGYLKVKQKRIDASNVNAKFKPGQWGYNDFVFDTEPSFLNEKEEDPSLSPAEEEENSRKKTVTEFTASNSPPLPMSNDLPGYKNGNVLSNVSDNDIELEEDAEETLPSSPEEDKEKRTSKSLYPLSSEQRKLFNTLKKEGFNCADEVLDILIRTNSKEKINNCLHHLHLEEKKGTQFRNGKIAFFRACINGKISLMGSEAQENKKRVVSEKKRLGWNSLEIYEKHCICNRTHKEVPFNLPKEEFNKKMRELYNLRKEYS